MEFYSVEASFGAAEPRLRDVTLFPLSGVPFDVAYSLFASQLIATGCSWSAPFDDLLSIVKVQVQVLSAKRCAKRPLRQQMRCCCMLASLRGLPSCQQAYRNALDIYKATQAN
ncbi:hypothetical protein HaLaN_32652 [Haematococcus lacustris]|uniref:Uncharacterized protein n=1 Tax=Haematococcus lacustris TaxID=44745 RepID=A0A6A0ALV8_HAELA|nr:hypothetical protein HaLaN_32652 [Haematococcus lacustris]